MSDKEKSETMTDKKVSQELKKSESEERLDEWLARFFAESSDEEVEIIESKCIQPTDFIVISD